MLHSTKDRFFQYIYDNLATNEELFDIYNKFYCAVSGSIVSPDRESNHDILKVKDMNGNCVVGKYYRCCTPCNCDIMKYTKIIKTKIAIPKPILLIKSDSIYSLTTG